MTKKIKNGGEKDIGVSGDPYTDSVLPDSIMIEIFLRLRILVIMNCKLVCKSWYKLLSHYSFTISYLRNPFFTHFFFPVNNSMFCLLEISKNGNCIKTPFYPKLPPDMLARELCLDVVGSCNGLLCLCLLKPGFDIVLVCNPIMGEYIVLPRHNMNAATYKFGFVPSTSKFKVLRITFKPFERGAIRREVDECHIFTVGVDDRWRSLVIPLVDLFGITGVLLNGALHFIESDKRSFLIRTFDFAEEKFGQISHPHDVVMDRNMGLKLFNNQLGLVDYSDKSGFTIWTMKEYGNVESWTKDVIQKIWFPSGARHRKLEPVGALQNGDILFARGTHLLSCDVKQKKCSKIGLFNEVHFIKPYAPSFSLLNEVLLNGNGEA